MSDSNTETSSDAHTVLECAECGYEIRPGDTRVPSTDSAIHITCSHLRDARKKYKFFISNPPTAEGCSLSLWFDAGDREYPILQNTGGLNAYLSASKHFSGDNAIEPTASFFRAIGYTYHWLQSYRPLPGDTDRIDTEIENEITKYYEHGKIPSHEEWAIYLIVRQMYQAPAVQPEWEPIVEYCDTITAFRVPDVIPYGDQQ
jgi:hypothetical protein